MDSTDLPPLFDSVIQLRHDTQNHYESQGDTYSFGGRLTS